ncbi:MAG: hypothetical protein ACQGVK_02140 [Myxococcota bacterium]
MSKPDPSPWRVAAIASALVVVGGALYLPVLGHEFVGWDDPIFFEKNPALAKGLSLDGLEWALTSTRAANWLPVTRLTLLLDHDLHGLDPTGVHAQNLAFHLASGVLLFLAGLRMTGRPFAAAALAAIFLLHPLNVESVAWASERKGMVSGFFWMLGLWVYSGMGERGVGERGLGWPRGLALAACLALGLMSKLVLVTLPAILLLLDFWPLRRLGDPGARRPIEPARLRRAVLEKIALVPLVLGATALVFVAQRSAGAVASLEQIPVLQRIANVLVSIGVYVGHFVWPRDLAVLYPYSSADLSTANVVAAALGVGVATLAACLQWRRRPYLLVGWTWFLVSLIPMSGLVQLGSAALADRYMYIPGIGLGLIVMGLFVELGQRGQRAHTAVVVAIVVMLALLAAASRQQLATWRDTVALFEHAIRVTRDNHLAHGQLGDAWLARGEERRAIDAYRRSLEIHPEQWNLANNLAWMLATHPEGDVRSPLEAIELARRASARRGGADPSVLDTLAAAQAAAGRFGAARQTATRALELAKRDAPALVPGVRQRLALYQAGRHYVEKPAPWPYPYENEQ